MNIIFLLISKILFANFYITKSASVIDLMLVESDSSCYLFCLEHGFDQATYFTSIDKEKNFYNNKFHIKVGFYLKIEKHLCEDIFNMKLINNSITPRKFYNKLQLLKAEIIQIDYNNTLNFSLKEENKQFEIVSSKKEAKIIQDEEINILRGLTYDLKSFIFIIKISDEKINFKVDDVYMHSFFLFQTDETNDAFNTCSSRVIFTKENLLALKSVLILPFSHDECLLLNQQTNPRKFLQRVKEMKTSREVEMFK